MGILLMNITAFAMPFAAYANPANFGTLRWPDVAMWAFGFVIVDGKMRAIFSALFGASMLLLADRAEAAGRSPVRLHYARTAALLLIGLAHACLIWDGDILVLYALTGAVAFLFRRLETERMLVLAGLLLAGQMAIYAIHYQALAALGAAAALPDATPDVVQAWRNVLDAIGRPSPSVLATDLLIHRGPWHRLALNMTGREFDAIASELTFNGPETLGLMLLGMAGLRLGFLTGAWQRTAYLRVARTAYLIGLPLLAVSAVVLIAKGFPPLLTATLDDLDMPLRWLVATGHVALLAAWFAGGSSPLKARIVAAGRAALTNYLGTSILMTAIFDGWGLGLYGHVERWQLLPFVVGGWAAMLLWSKPWLDRFAYGPLEWLWRLLARGRIPEFRRQAIES
ncbi:DUF418 domain-containing protein [Sphingomonas sp. MMS24-J13]|uniref:DUF418 domain-containing protein n=1 Tax=Sphingomonas sp. MMS24-J13 TaxID=3238686 RepID=UPI00385145A6